MEIKQAVNLHVYPSTKFKNIRVSLFFRAPLTSDTMTTRVLLAQLLETNSSEYPTQTHINQALSDLYGLSFSTNITTYGEEHIVSANFSLADPKILKLESSYLNDVFNFIQSVIFQPNIKNQKFDQKTFDREKIDLKEYVLAQKDDKTLITLENLMEITFENEAKQALSGIQIEKLDQLKNEEVVEAYNHMIQTDNVDIVVYGNVREADFKTFSQSLPLKDRTERSPQYYYSEDFEKIINEVKQTNNAQTRLAQAYKTPIRQDDSQYLAGLIFNSLFGGDLHSKLFQNVREKESLAYSISSLLMSDAGLMLVYAGIDKKNVNQTKDIIAEQLQDIRDGNISDDELSQSKSMLINKQKALVDDSGRLVKKIYQDVILDKEVQSLEETINKIEKVSKEDIIRIAKQVSLQSEFILQGK